jgi:hypothetical protein
MLQVDRAHPQETTLRALGMIYEPRRAPRPNRVIYKASRDTYDNR